MTGSSWRLRWWEKDHSREGSNGAGEGAEGEVEGRVRSFREIITF